MLAATQHSPAACLLTLECKYSSPLAASSASTTRVSAPATMSALRPSADLRLPPAMYSGVEDGDSNNNCNPKNGRSAGVDQGPHSKLCAGWV